ncbi:MAG TPA: hypothetical protein VD905_07915 [Flavobacteriales bacterium]|nr:hypothetical protein [Flavobacteriales bacterium]
MNKKKRALFSVELLIGPWRKVVPGHICKMLIAEALSEGVCHKKPLHEIMGYLITSRRVFIVMDIPDKNIHELFRDFYERIRKKIKPYLHSHKEHYDTAKTDKEMVLFEKHELRNNYLIRLLCGKKVALKYYDPNLERLKNMLQKQEYCSMVDYSGAIGPVIMHCRSCEHVKDENQHQH